MRKQNGNKTESVHDDKTRPYCLQKIKTDSVVTIGPDIFLLVYQILGQRREVRLISKYWGTDTKTFGYSIEITHNICITLENLSTKILF